MTSKEERWDAEIPSDDGLLFLSFESLEDYIEWAEKHRERKYIQDWWDRGGDM